MLQKKVRRLFPPVLIIVCLFAAYSIYSATISTMASRFQMYSHMKVAQKLQYFGVSWTLTPEVFSPTATMTFNNTLVVHCKKSPYIECSPLEDIQPKPGKIFKIAYLRRPGWLTQSEMEVRGCQINQCTMADNKVTNDTDIVVVYGILLKDTFQVPQRWPNQLYAIHIWEPPGRTSSDFLSNAKSQWNHQINVMVSYRVDAEVFIPYDKLMFTPKPLTSRPNYYEIAKSKMRTAVWIVSHCKSWSKREAYVQEMQVIAKTLRQTCVDSHRLGIYIEAPPVSEREP